MENMRDFRHLSFASSLCGNCTDVCPVKIPLHELLLVNRQESVDLGLTSGGQRFLMKNMKRALLKRNMMNMGGGMKNLLFRNFFKSAWGPRREIPKLETKTFNKLWKEQQEKNKKSANEDDLTA
jgi:L-lactate dehydrogenase complex protein LldF